MSVTLTVFSHFSTLAHSLSLECQSAMKASAYTDTTASLVRTTFIYLLLTVIRLFM